MHPVIEFLLFWTLAFVSLCLAVVLLLIFDSLIEDDLELHSLGKEAALAGFASLIEAASLWVILRYIGAMGLRAMIVPILMVMLLYKIAHLTDWSKYDAGFLVVFQIFICCLIGTLITGHFAAAILMTVAFVICLAIVASFAKSL